MNTANLVEEINVFSEQKLKRKNDLKILLEMSFKNEKSVLLENLSFTAKYIRGLERVLKKGSMNPEISNIEQIKQDYTNNIKKLIDQISCFKKRENIRKKNQDYTHGTNIVSATISSY